MNFCLETEKKSSCNNIKNIILRKHKYNLYKVYLVDDLSEDDSDLRTQFCEQILGMRNEFLDLSQNIILFLHEAIFCLNGIVNGKNCKYWAKENPHKHRPQIINDWARIVGNQVLGPFFFKRTLIGEHYFLP